LGGGQAEAGAVETMTDRRHDDRHEVAQRATPMTTR
jgi:hypothetical protein